MFEKRKYIFKSTTGKCFQWNDYCKFLAKRELKHRFPDFVIESVRSWPVRKKRRNSRGEQGNIIAERMDKIIAGAMREAIKNHGCAPHVMKSSAVKRITRRLLGDEALMQDIRKLKKFK